MLQPKPAGKTAVIYARYSSHNQRDVSIEQQVNACRKYARDNDLDVIRVYDDHAMTGTNDQRPQFQAMIRDSATRAFQVVLVYQLDRFSRDRYDAAIYKRTLRENGVRVLSAMEHITDDPTGVLMESILEGFAEYYSRELAQKTRRGLRNNAEHHMVIGTVSYGYQKGQDGRYEIVPAEAAVVREIFTRVAAGEPFTAIAASLNDRGLLTRRGGPWNNHSFARMIHNERYIGVYTYDDLRFDDAIPPIIDRDLFDRVQALCRTKPCPQGSPRRRKKGDNVYLLTGKLYCGECKGPMVGQSGTGLNGGLYYYYMCRDRHDKHAPCRKRPVRQEYVETLVASELQKVISKPDAVAWIADKTAQYLCADHDSDEIALLREQLDVAKREKENTLRAIRTGAALPSSVLQMLADLEDKEATLAAKLSVAEDRMHSEITRDDVVAWVESFAAGDVHDKKYQETLFDAFLVRAWLYEDKITIVFTATGANPGEIEASISLNPDAPPPADALVIPDSADSSDKGSKGGG